VKTILERYEYKSVCSGEDDIGNLSIMPLFEDIDPAPWHCIVLSKREIKSIAQTNNIAPGSGYARIPEELRAKLNLCKWQRIT